MVLECKDCGRNFELTSGEIEFYKSRGLNLPKRCEECRKKNKKIGASAGASENAHEFNSNKNGKATLYIKNQRDYKKYFLILACIAAAIVLVFAAGRVLKNSDVFIAEDESETFFAGFTEIEIETPEIPSQAETSSHADYVTTTAYTTTPTTSAPYYAPAQYRFRNNKLLTSHYQKHGIEMGFSSKEAYEAAASAVVTNPKALFKHEAEDNDGVYFIESTGEIVFLSGDGYIRTYFITDKDYFDRQ
jgi:hypothetical protein